MSKNSTRYLLVAAGVFALVPSLARGFEGNLVKCNPTSPGPGTTTTFSPGLTCTEAFNKITVKATVKLGNPVDNCVANPAAPWDTWATGKYGSKITGAAAATITKADIVIAGITFGTCNFGGSPDAFGANGGGSITFYDATSTKVKGGGGSFYGKVSGDLTTQSAQLVALMVKGFAVGANIMDQVAIDLGNPVNGVILGCNTGGLCPPDVFTPKGNASCGGKVTDAACCQSKTCTAATVPAACCTGAGTGCKGLGACIPPATQLALTNPPGPIPPPSVLSIDIVGNTLCTAGFPAPAPYKCCTGAGTGTCGLYY